MPTAHAPDPIWHRAIAASRSGQWDVTEAACRSLLALQPRHVGARLKLSHALLSQGHYREARDVACAATEALARDLPAALAVARRLRYFEEHERLRDVLARIASWGRIPLEAALDAAALAISIGSHPLASGLIEGARRDGAKDPRWHYQKGMLATFKGATGEAEHAFEQCIALLPDFAQAHWMLSRLSPVDAGHNHVVRLQKAFARAVPRSEAAAYLAFALHHELHSLQRFDEAWAALATTFGDPSWAPRHDNVAIAARFDALHAAFSEPRDAGNRTGDFRPLFIVGMHRSGTSLVERMLSGHSDVADAGESDAFPAQLRLLAGRDTREAVDIGIVQRSAAIDRGALAAAYFSSSRWRTGGKSALTEKLPHNFLNVGFIAESLADARIVHLARDPMDVCFSNLRTFFRGMGSYSYDLVRMAEFYAGYHRLMEHWCSIYSERIYTVDYSRLVHEPEAVAREVLAHCGLDFEPAVLDVGRAGGVVSTASTAQVRTGFDTRRGEAWRPYERQLAPMVETLRQAGLVE